MSERGNNREQPIGDGTTPPTRGPFQMLPLLILLIVAMGSLAILNRTGPEESVRPTTTTAPDPLSQPDPVTIDARTSSFRAPDTRWSLADLDPSVHLQGVIGAGSRFIGVGSDSEGPGLWESETGEHWSLASRLEPPSDTDPGLWWQSETWGFRVYRLRDSTVVLGSDGAKTASWLDGEFRGYTDVFVNLLPDQVIAGDELLGFELIFNMPTGESSEPEERWWLSEDGVAWTSVDPTGIPDMVGNQPIGFVDGIYYASATMLCLADAACDRMFRSTDGVLWEPVHVDAPAGSSYKVGGLAKTEGKLIAAGYVETETDSQIALWTSRDGSTWAYSDVVDAFQTSSVDVGLVSIGDGGATISVDGVEYELPEGSVLETDAGTMTVQTITNNSVRLSPGAGFSLLRPGDSAKLERTTYMWTIASNGHWLAISGAVGYSLDGDTSGTRTNTTWLSDDGGVTWTATHVDTEQEARGDGDTAMTDTSIVKNVGNQIWYRRLGD